MARSRDQKNGRLEEAIAILIQTQASFLSRMAATDERFAHIDVRFSQIASILLEHSRILAEHTKMLQGLSDAIRDKIGFKGARD